MGRILPSLDGPDAPFWTSGADGVLRVARCEACARWVHPATGSCRECGGELTWAPVSGRGTVFTFTVNHQVFNPDVPVPYVIALVTLDEQDDLRIPTNIVECDPDAVGIGMPVQVRFEEQDGVFFPLFAPV
ncbi:MAG: OB-fold domain-containing protein [Acidimicrobiia bacterium]